MKLTKLSSVAMLSFFGACTAVDYSKGELDRDEIVPVTSSMAPNNSLNIASYNNHSNTHIGEKPLDTGILPLDVSVGKQDDELTLRVSTPDLLSIFNEPYRREGFGSKGNFNGRNPLMYEVPGRDTYDFLNNPGNQELPLSELFKVGKKLIWESEPARPAREISDTVSGIYSGLVESILGKGTKLNFGLKIGDGIREYGVEARFDEKYSLLFTNQVSQREDKPDEILLFLRVKL